MDTKWLYKDLAPQNFVEQFPEYHPIVLQLLYSRGLKTADDIEQFLTPDYTTDVHNPFLFRDMHKAVKRIWKAVDNNERIVIYGDYDADGVCSTALLMDFLKKFTNNIVTVLPHRSKEGYGLNPKTLPKVQAENPNLVITLDCGSTSVEEVAELKKDGIDTIIGDHHHEPEVHPDALAIINCSFKDETYPTKNLAAVGIAYKIVQGLVDYGKEHRSNWDFPLGFEKWYLDLVAIATVADCVPLYGENRTFVKFGLQVLNKTRRLGLQSLIKKTGIELGHITERHLGFVIGPRINAAGRIKHSFDAFELLIASTPEEAEMRAEQINNDNSERQKITEQYFKEAKIALAEAVERGDAMLFFYNPNWNIGLAGLVAGKLLTLYKRPIIVMSDADGVVKGSGRSIHTFDLASNLDKMSELFTAYGGHVQACGFTLKSDVSVETLQKRFLALAEEQIGDNQISESLNVDMEIPLSEVNWDLYEILEKFAPFGQDAPKPVFVSKNVLVQAVDLVGANQKHLRITVSDDNGMSRKTIAFGFAEHWADELKYGDFIDIAYDVDVNEWNGSRELQLKLIDIKKSTK